jgi:hypothetical protein
MQYTNVKVPADMACMDTDKDVHDILRALTGYDEFINASIGRSSYGPYWEGDIDYMADCKGYSLAYDFMVNGDTARVFRYQIDRQICFDKED